MDSYYDALARLDKRHVQREADRQAKREASKLPPEDPWLLWQDDGGEA